MHNLIFLLFLLTIPLSLVSMNNENCKKLLYKEQLYFQQLDAKKSPLDWSNSASETFFFINNCTKHEIPEELKEIIKHNFIALTKIERDLWNNEKFNNWDIPITLSDFANLNKKNKLTIFQLRHANRSTTKADLSIKATNTFSEYKEFLFFDNECYLLLQQLPLPIKIKIAAIYNPYVVINESTQTNKLTDAYIGIYTVSSSVVDGSLFKGFNIENPWIKKPIIPEDYL